MNRKMKNELPHVTLPGRLYCKQARWWWKVQLPGEKSPRSRALKPEGSRRATTDRQLADEIAFTLWQEAVRAEARAVARAEEAVRMQRLRQHFREKIKALQDVIESAEVRAEAVTTERAKLEVQLNSMRTELTQMASCGCCGHSVPESELRAIDSGQRLCQDCLTDLHGAAQRQSSQPQKAEDEPQRIRHATPGTAGRDSCRHPSSVRCSRSSAGREDLLSRRNIHGADVLYTEAGSR